MIPITLFYDSRRIELNGSNPMLMIAYGNKSIINLVYLYTYMYMLKVVMEYPCTLAMMKHCFH